MIVEIGINVFAALAFTIWYLYIRLHSIKTVGICVKKLNSSRGFQEFFEYEIDGIKYCNLENSPHICSCKLNKKYTIYVNKNDYDKIVSGKVLADMLFFIIFFSALSGAMFYLEYVCG